MILQRATDSRFGLGLNPIETKTPPKRHPSSEHHVDVRSQHVRYRMEQLSLICSFVVSFPPSFCLLQILTFLLFPFIYNKSLSLSTSIKMEAKVALQNRSPFLTLTNYRRDIIKQKPKYSPCIIAVLTTPTKDNNSISTSSKTVYKDGWFNRLAINHLSQSVQDAIGLLILLLNHLFT